MTTLKQVIELISQLSIEEQETLIETLQRRTVESRRAEIARDAQKSMADFRAGKLKVQSVDEIILELRQSM